MLNAINMFSIDYMCYNAVTQASGLILIHITGDVQIEPDHIFVLFYMQSQRTTHMHFSHMLINSNNPRFGCSAIHSQSIYDKQKDPCKKVYQLNKLLHLIRLCITCHMIKGEILYIKQSYFRQDEENTISIFYYDLQFIQCLDIFFSEVQTL